MKRKAILLFAAAAAAMLALTACTSSEQMGAQGGAAGGVSDAGSAAGANEGGDSGLTGGDEAAPIDAGGDTSVQPVPEAGGPLEDGGPVGDVIPDEYADAAEAGQTESGAEADAWSGTYTGAEETLTLALMDGGNLAFSFAQSGISGTAAVNGTQAVYNGDDHHVVVFNLSGDTVDVSVSSEEDYDASASPLNGTYTKAS